MPLRHLIVLSAAAAATSCAVGPNFRAPPAPTARQYTAGAEPTETAAASGVGGAAQRLVRGAGTPARWWESLSCAPLNALVDEALTRSPTLLEARARLREAQQDFTAQARGTRYPDVDTQFGITRQKVDPAAFGIPNVPAQPPFTLYNAQISVSYSLDVFGGNRRLLEGAAAQRDYQAYEAQAAELTLAANVVAAAIRQADLEAQIEFTQQLLEAQGRQDEIGEDRYLVGGIALQELQVQHSQLEQLRANLPALRAERQRVDHELSVYTGRAPAEAAIPSFKLEDFDLPVDLPVTLPAELVRRRPDVRASEALWHRASANVGVASANLFPALTLSANAGSERTNASDLVDSFNVWSVGAKLLQPLFHAGELQAKKRSAVAAYDAAAQAYEQTVLESLQQVADGLRVVEGDALILQARSLSADRSAAGFSIAQQRFEVGGISEVSYLDFKRQHLQNELDRSHAQAQRLADTVALLHALAGPVQGGG